MTNKKEWVDREHYRVTTEGGRRSYLYKANLGLFSSDTCVEVADHHSNGTTDAYEPDTSIIGGLFNGCRGKKKN
jgi:hypothetical protein